MKLPGKAAMAEAAWAFGFIGNLCPVSSKGRMSSTSQSFQSPGTQRCSSTSLGWMSAGSGPYGLMEREDLALNINRVLFQELLCSASLGFPCPVPTPCSPGQMASRRLPNVLVIKKPSFSKPFHSLFF